METKTSITEYREEQELALQTFISSTSDPLLLTLQNAQLILDDILMKTDLHMLTHAQSEATDTKELQDIHRNTLRQLLKIFSQKSTQSKLNLDLAIIDNQPEDKIDICQFKKK